MTQQQRRNAMQDLEICEKAVGGPWEQKGHAVLSGSQPIAMATIHTTIGNLELMALSYEALPYWIKEAERMKARADQLASESSSQFVSTTNALMRAEAAEQELEAQRIRADKAEQESEKWRVEAFRKYPTPEAYELSCEAREKHRQRADLAEQERDKLSAIIQGVYAIAQNDLNRWNGGMTVGTTVFQDRVYARNLVKDLQPLLFPEGSNTDAKRD